MSVTFTKYRNTVLVTFTEPYIPISEAVKDENGNVIQDAVGTQTEVLDPPLAGRLFAESHMPAVGDNIIFNAPAGPAQYVDSIRVQGRDMPKTTGWTASPTTYVFAVANGPSFWTVTAVGQDDSVTIVRGDT